MRRIIGWACMIATTPAVCGEYSPYVDTDFPRDVYFGDTHRTKSLRSRGTAKPTPKLSPKDAFADYEPWDRANFDDVPKTKPMLLYEYARSALMPGLELGASLGKNPCQFGMIGSTDSQKGADYGLGGQLLRQDDAHGTVRRPLAGQGRGR